MADIMNPFMNNISQGINRANPFGGDMLYRTPPFVNTPPVIDESGGFYPTPPMRRPDFNSAEGRIGKRWPDLFSRGALEVPPSAPEEDDLTSLYNSIYSPDTRYGDMYGKGLEEMPQRNKPGIWRRIAASIVGGGGGDAQAALYAPYLRQMADWKAKMDAIQPAMGYERQSNAIGRQAASDIARDRIAQRREDTRIRDLERKEKTDAENIAIRQGRLAVAEYKAKNPTRRFFEDEQGNLVAVDPVSQDAEYVIGPDGPINTGKLSDAERINLDIQGRIKVARVQGEEARKTEGTRSANDLREIAARGAEQRETKTTPANEGQEQVTETTVAVTDAEGNPTGARTTRQTRVTQKPGSTTKFKDPKTNKIYNIPNSDKAAIAEARKRKYQEVK